MRSCPIETAVNHSFKAGDKVRIKHRDYSKEVAEVSGHSISMLGRPLLDVIVTYNDGATEDACFYPIELELLDAAKPNNKTEEPKHDDNN
jgi:hypothetical protein